MKIIRTLLLGTVLGAAAVHAQVPSSESAAEAVAEGKLVEGKSRFRETWVNPDADFTQYNKILLGDSEFQFRDVGPAKKYRSSLGSTGSKQEFGIFPEDQEKFKQVAGEAFVKELSRSKKYDIVTEAAPGTLLLEAAVLDIVSHVPPEVIGGRSSVYLASVASATLVLEIHDAVTGETLAYVEERRKIEQPGGQINSFSTPANSVTVWSEVGRWARSSASRLRTSLEKAQKGK